MLAGGFVSCNRDNDEQKTPEPEFYFEGYLNGKHFTNGTWRLFDEWRPVEEIRPAVGTFYNPDSLVINGRYYLRLIIQGWNMAPVSTYSYPPIPLPTDISIALRYTCEGKHNAVYISINSSRSKLFDNESSWITIRKFDTINKIVAGTFQFVGYYSFESSDQPIDVKIKITEGRFRAPLHRLQMASPRSPYDVKLQMLKLLTLNSKKIIP